MGDRDRARYATRGTCDEYVAVTPLPSEQHVRVDIQAASDITLTMRAAHQFAIAILSACEDVVCGCGDRDGSDAEDRPPVS